MGDHDLSPPVVARVREAADMVEIVSEHVALKRRGRNWVGLCPFHEEKTPSFSVNPEKGLYYCFGCHAGGDVIDFVMRLNRMDFPEAVEYLARRFGVELPPRSPDQLRRQRTAERTAGILEEAQRFFVARLSRPDAATARSTLVERGFPEESWREFGFGYAPDDWRQLLEALGRRHPVQALIDAGLAVTPDRGGTPYDRFRNRITFPIRATDGKLIAFGGRALGDTEPKYLNSPENALFRKRSVLFMLDRARRAIADAGAALVVEGYFDCLSLHRAGVANVVATLGTSLTQEHARLLRRLTSRVILAYDADAAGRRAAGQGARVLLEAGLEPAVLVLPAGRDPDDIVREEGVERFRELLECPTPLIDFLLAEAPRDASGRRQVGREVAELVAVARDPVTRFALQEELARRLDLPLSVVTEAGRRRGAERPRRQASGPAPPDPVPSGELELARILLEAPATVRDEAIRAIVPDFLRSEAVRELFRLAAELAAAGGEDLSAAVLARAEDSAVQRLVARVTTSDLPPVDEDRARQLIRSTAAAHAKEQARRLQEAIREAEARGDNAELARLLAEKASLRRR